MTLEQLNTTLCEIFGQQNVKPHDKEFRVIVDYEDMPYCVIVKVDDDGSNIKLNKDAIDEKENNYNEAYRKAYRLLVKHGGKIDVEVDI